MGESYDKLRGLIFSKDLNWIPRCNAVFRPFSNNSISSNINNITTTIESASYMLKSFDMYTRLILIGFFQGLLELSVSVQSVFKKYTVRRPTPHRRHVSVWSCQLGKSKRPCSNPIRISSSRSVINIMANNRNGRGRANKALNVRHL